MTKLPIPDGVLKHHGIVLGKTRSGKSSVLRLITERLLDEAKPVCIIDPKGDWWGLKSSATGKSAGYPVIIFGGDHADVPLNAHAGAHVAELVATGNRPAIIDLGGWMVGERTRFFIDFASTLFKLTRGPRVLVIDEVHNFAPQGKVLDPEAGKMLHWANRLASEGAGKGITLLSASQRPQKVHKDFVTSNETLIAMRVIHPLDRAAIKDWVDGYDPKVGTEVLGSLAQMKRGEGWVWSPEIGFGPERVKFPLFSTFDSFAAPTTEGATKLKGWASVDLEEVTAKLAAVVEEAKANDPKALKAEVARLKAELARNVTAAADPDAVASAEDRGYQLGRTDGYNHAISGVTAELAAVLDAIGTVDIARKNVEQATNQLAAWVKRAAKGPPDAAMPRPAPSVPPQKPSYAKPPARPYMNGLNPDRPIGAERKPLAALARVYPAGMTEAQWAVAAGLKRTGGTWSTYKSRLNQAHRVEERAGLWYATAQGVEDLGGDIEQMPPPGPQLVEWWAGKIDGAGPMLKHLAGMYPKWMRRDDLAADLGLTASGGTFSTYLSRLRSPGLIETERDGKVRASPALMGE